MAAISDKIIYTEYQCLHFLNIFLPNYIDAISINEIFINWIIYSGIKITIVIPSKIVNKNFILIYDYLKILIVEI